MPKRYEAMRDKFASKPGTSMKSAKTKAAKIYNSTKKSNEPNLHSGKKKAKKKGRSFSSLYRG